MNNDNFTEEEMLEILKLLTRLKLKLSNATSGGVADLLIKKANKLEKRIMECK